MVIRAGFFIMGAFLRARVSFEEIEVHQRFSLGSWGTGLEFCPVLLVRRSDSFS